MSKLESFIRRMQAQVVCLDRAASMISDVPGVVWEVGLGNGRSFDHLRERLPDRHIYAFDRAVNAHPTCIPDDEHMILGDIFDTLPAAVERFRGQVAMVHTDIGSGDVEQNAVIARFIGNQLAPALCEGAVIISDRDLYAPWLATVPLPDGIFPGRYFMFRHGGGDEGHHSSSSAA